MNIISNDSKQKYGDYVYGLVFCLMAYQPL